MDKKSERLFSFIGECHEAPDKRPRAHFEWAGICIHHTGLTKLKPETEEAWKKILRGTVDWLIEKDAAYVSAHFVIGRSGEIEQLVNPDYWVAYHAGLSEYWNQNLRKFMPNCNDWMIGIELVGDGNQDKYSEAQYNSLALLCSSLMKRYLTIQPNCITGHEAVSPGRKVDPGLFFDWRLLHKKLWTHL